MPSEITPTKPEDAPVESYRELRLLLESAKQWCGIFDVDGQMRHGSSDAPFRAADAITTLLERVQRLEHQIRIMSGEVGRAALTGMDK